MRAFHRHLIIALCLLAVPFVQPAEAQVVEQDFWPMDDVSDLNRPWWRFRWTNGGNYPQDKCAVDFTRHCTKGEQQDGLIYLSTNQHAFEPPRTQTVVNVVKEDFCGYWSPTTDRQLRWYAEGWKEAMATEEAGETLSFLSFRGWTEWTMGEQNTGIYTTSLYPPMPDADFVVDGAIGAYREKTMARQVHLENNVWSGAEDKFPTYTAVPDESLPLELQITSGQAELGGNFFEQHDGTSWQPRGTDIQNLTYHGCNAVLEDGDEGMATASATCMSGSDIDPGGLAVWRLSTRPTSYQFNGHDVIYVAYAEGPEAADVPGVPGGTVVCEEWFFAENVGPIAIAQLPIMDSVQQCIDELAMSNGGLADPQAYYQSQATLDRIIGYQWLEDYCHDFCWVGDTNEAPTPDPPPPSDPDPVDPPPVCEPCTGPFCPDVVCDPAF